MKGRLCWALLVAVCRTGLAGAAATLLCFLCGVSRAQDLPPTAPVFPKSSQECQQYNAAVETYATRIEKEHDDCLKTHKPDRNLPPDDPKSPNPICSRSACQYLHDALYGPNELVSMVKRVRGQAARCYSQVSQYLAREKAEQEAEAKKKEQPPLINPFGNDADDGSKTDEARAKEVKAATAAIARSSAKYLRDTVKEWRGAEEKGLKPQLKITLESLKAVKTAAGGEIPSTVEPIEKTAAFLDSERKFLSALAQQSQSDWLDMSGVNYHDRSTIPEAQAFIDDWSRRLALQDRIIQGFIPVVEKGRDVLDKIAGPRAAFYTPTGLDAPAVEDFIPALNDCSQHIKQIQTQLSLARSLLY